MKSALKFVDGSSLLSGNPLCRSSSVCLFDIDGDDEPEIIISNTNFKNLVYKYSEEKKCFVPISISALECPRKKRCALQWETFWEMDVLRFMSSTQKLREG